MGGLARPHAGNGNQGLVVLNCPPAGGAPAFDIISPEDVERNLASRSRFRSSDGFSDPPTAGSTTFGFPNQQVEEPMSSQTSLMRSLAGRRMGDRDKLQPSTGGITGSKIGVATSSASNPPQHDAPPWSSANRGCRRENGLGTSRPSVVMQTAPQKKARFGLSTQCAPQALRSIDRRNRRVRKCLSVRRLQSTPANPSKHFRMPFPTRAGPARAANGGCCETPNFAGRVSACRSLKRLLGSFFPPCGRTTT